MKLGNKSGSIFSGLFLICTNRPCRLEAIGRGFFSKSSGHVIRVPPPSARLVRSLRRPETTPWHQDWNIAAATALAAIAVWLRYGETVPYSGRTHLAVLSHKEARRRGEADFAKFKRENASKLLDPGHPDTVRVRRIVELIVRAAHHGLAIQKLHAANHARPNSWRQHLSHDGLDWMERLDWEVVVLENCEDDAMCFTGAGKIVVHTGLLHCYRTDVEIAAALAHEVGHVIARHSSGIRCWLLPIFEVMPILILPILPFLLHFKRRCEFEADHIGILLLAAAGVDPMTAVTVMQKGTKLRGEDSTWSELFSYFSTHPCGKKRWQFLLQPKVMEEASTLYRQVTSHAQA